MCIVLIPGDADIPAAADAGMPQRARTLAPTNTMINRATQRRSAQSPSTAILDFPSIGDKLPQYWRQTIQEKPAGGQALEV